MNIEHFLYGMVNEKIVLYKTAGVTALITDKNFQFLRDLTPADSDHYLWLPTEQVVALPHVEQVGDSKGRMWVLNHTLLIPIHDYLKLSKPMDRVKHLFIRDVDAFNLDSFDVLEWNDQP